MSVALKIEIDNYFFLFISKYRMSVHITRTPNSSKAFVAVFTDKNNKTKTVRFGTDSNYVLNHNKTKKDRDNYIKRHSVRENFNSPMTAGALSKHILWGESRSLTKNINAFKKKFKLN